MKQVTSGYATWFTAGGAIRIALRQLWQTWELRHYNVIDDVIEIEKNGDHIAL